MPVMLAQEHFLFFKKINNVHQHYYSTIEKECLILILTMQHYDIKPITVFSDHNHLVFLHKMTNKNRRLLNWILQEYSLQIKHDNGKDNICADALCRNCCC